MLLDSLQADDQQRAWLTRDLAAARRHRARAIVAVCHGGPWAHGVHGGTGAMERALVPALIAGGTDVLFSGHDHLYERGVGTTAQGALPYVVTGGGGSPLYSPACQPASGPSLAEGGRPLPPCPPSVASIIKAYHYVVVEVGPRNLRLCPKALDGSALEPCTDVPLHARPRAAQP